jgi:hypothetical protein
MTIAVGKKVIAHHVDALGREMAITGEVVQRYEKTEGSWWLVDIGGLRMVFEESQLTEQNGEQ